MTAAAAHPYAPKRIDGYLREWLAVESGAESPETSRHYRTWEHRNQAGPCEREQRLDQGQRYHGDPMGGADLRADLEAAIATLPAYSLEAAAVCQMVRAGLEGHRGDQAFAAVAKALGRRKNDVREAYLRGCRLMALALGWSEG